MRRSKCSLAAFALEAPICRWQYLPLARCCKVLSLGLPAQGVHRSRQIRGLPRGGEVTGVLLNGCWQDAGAPRGSGRVRRDGWHRCAPKSKYQEQGGWRKGAEAVMLLSKKQAETANAVLLHCEQNAGAPRDVVGAALALLQRAFSAHSSRLAPLLPPSRKVRSHKSLAKCSSKAMARFTPCRRMLSKLDKSTRLRSRRRSSRLCWASKLKRCSSTKSTLQRGSTSS